MTSPLDCSILVSEADVFALADEWRALHKRVGNGLFTDYDWFRIWWQTMGKIEGRTLHIVTGRKDGSLVALLPLVVTQKKGFRVLQAVGAEAFYFCDLLCETPEQANALWKTARQSTLYDFAHLRDTTPNSECERALSSFAHLQDRAKMLILTHQWPTAQDWKATFTKQFKRNISKAERLLQEKGPLRWEICRDEPIPPGIIEGMVEHKTIWCNTFDKRGMFDQPNVLSYYQQIAEDAQRQHMLLLAWLKCGDAIIAYHLMFPYKKTLYSVVMATNAEWLKYSPGHLAHIYAISWAIENGFSEFNHMQGDYAYKYQFSNTIRECREYSFARSLKGWLGMQLFFKRRALKRYIRKTEYV